MCSYKLQILADCIVNFNVFSLILTPYERNRHICERFKTLNLINWVNSINTNIIDDQGLKTFLLTPTRFYCYNHFKQTHIGIHINNKHTQKLLEICSYILSILFLLSSGLARKWIIGMLNPILTFLIQLNCLRS